MFSDFKREKGMVGHGKYKYVWEESHMHSVLRKEGQSFWLRELQVMVYLFLERRETSERRI